LLGVSYLVTVDHDLVLVGKLLVMKQAPPGETGARGPIGWPGKDGRNSDVPGPAGKSVKGEPGPIGLDGRAATIHVGKVTTVPHGQGASVINVGTSRDAVLDFTIPEGRPGRNGVDGKSIEGPRGENGPAGDVLYVSGAEVNGAILELKAQRAEFIAKVVKHAESKDKTGINAVVAAHFRNLLKDLQK